MSIGYGLVFAVLAALSALAALLVSEWSLWPLRVAGCAAALSFLLVAVVYCGAGPRLLLKRADGRRVAWAWLVHWPFFTLTAFSYRVSLLISREAAYVQVAPNVFLGRRLSARETRHARKENWLAVLDLVAEMPEPRALRDCANYRLLPVLDAAAMTLDELRDAVAWVRKFAATGPVYVHCALGHGRSATVVAAYLLSEGLAVDVKAALKHLRELRPGVRLQRTQRKVLEEFGERGRKPPVLFEEGKRTGGRSPTLAPST